MLDVELLRFQNWQYGVFDCAVHKLINEENDSLIKIYISSFCQICLIYINTCNNINYNKISYFVHTVLKEIIQLNQNNS